MNPSNDLLAFWGGGWSYVVGLVETLVRVDAEPCEVGHGGA